MSESTKIEWCDHTWSPWRGCTKVSPGCANCYAETLSKRNPAVLGQWGKGKPRVLAKNWNDPLKWNEKSCWICPDCGKGFKVGSVQFDDDCHCKPRQFRGATKFRRARVFPSLCDWLDEEVPVEWLARFLKLIHETPNIDWLLLTKRPEAWRKRMTAAHSAAIFDAHDLMAREWIQGRPPENVWVGASVEDQPRSDERIPALLKIPARRRFLSVEPLLGPISLSLKCPRDYNGDGDCDLHPHGCPQIDWVIVGGESGPAARPCNVDWIRSIVAQCKAAGVQCFVKQLGAVAFEGRFNGKADPASFDRCERLNLKHPKGGDPAEWPEDLRLRQFPEVKP